MSPVFRADGFQLSGPLKVLSSGPSFAQTRYQVYVDGWIRQDTWVMEQSLYAPMPQFKLSCRILSLNSLCLLSHKNDARCWQHLSLQEGMRYNLEHCVGQVFCS